MPGFDTAGVGREAANALRRLADAILDRIVHSSHKIELKVSRSLRDKNAAASATLPAMANGSSHDRRRNA